MQEELQEGAQVAEIEQALRELAKEASGLGMQKMIEASEKNMQIELHVNAGRSQATG